MSGVEIGLGLVALVDICITRGRKLYTICKSFSNAEEEILERALRIKTCWIRVHHQLEIMTQEVVDVMSEDLKNNFSEILILLVGKLDKCLQKIESLLHPKTEDGIVRPLTRTPSQQWAMKAKFAFRMKESLDLAIEDLEVWQKLFDPAWWMSIKALSPVVAGLSTTRSGNQSLTDRFPPLSGIVRSSTTDTLADQASSSSPFFLSIEDITAGVVIDDNLPFSHVRLGHRKDKCYLLEPICRFEGRDGSVQAKAIRSLAKKLGTADPVFFNLLVCKGVIKEEQRFTFVFSIPPDLSKPQSLRALLLAGSPPATLSDRFQVAKDLVKSVLFVHYFSYVHKNIRPETVWLLRRASGNVHEFSTYLLGWEAFRHDEGRTANIGDTQWEKNLYRHPQRQGSSPQETYTMQHDIYSIGVCLLEIGLWQSLVAYNDGSESGSPSTLLKDALSSAGSRSADTVPKTLARLAQQHLPAVVGVRYCQVVQTCLTCLDPENLDFGDTSKFEDEDGVMVGMRYIQKVSKSSSVLSLELRLT